MSIKSSVKFNKHNVRNILTGDKARINYSLTNYHDNRKCITLYEKDYDRYLERVFPDAFNGSDILSDYFEKSKITFFEDDPRYEDAMAVVKKFFPNKLE